MFLKHLFDPVVDFSVFMRLGGHMVPFHFRIVRDALDVLVAIQDLIKRLSLVTFLSRSIAWNVHDRDISMLFHKPSMVGN